jgi:hypothetical protein
LSYRQLARQTDKQTDRQKDMGSKGANNIEERKRKKRRQHNQIVICHRDRQIDR